MNISLYNNAQVINRAMGFIVEGLDYDDYFKEMLLTKYITLPQQRYMELEVIIQNR